MKENPANAIKDTMWTFLMDKGQASNIPALKEYVYNLIGMTTQKTAGQRKTAKNDIPWEQLDMTLMSIVIEATALVLSGDLEKLEQFGDKTGKYAGMIESFECDFSLAVERGNEYGLDDLQVKIEQGNNKLLSDIELLKELSYGLRSGSLKIIKQPEKGGDPPIEK